MPPRENNTRIDLVAAAIGDKTAREYKNALKQFTTYCRQNSKNTRNTEALDKALLDYFQHEFQAPGRDGRGHCTKVVNAVKHFCPETKNKLPLAHRALTGWGRLRPSQQKTPCPHDLTLGIAYFLRINGFDDMGLAVILMFDCHLRIEELRSLTPRTVLQEAAPHKGIYLVLPKTKGGSNQSVKIRIKLVWHLMKRRLASFQGNLDDRLFPFSADSFRNEIHKITREILPINNPLLNTITPHCFRCGGATRDYMLSRLFMQGLMYRGRWKNLATVYNYVRVAQTLMVQVAIKESARNILQELNANAGRFFNVQEVNAGWEEFSEES